MKTISKILKKTAILLLTVFMMAMAMPGLANAGEKLPLTVPKPFTLTCEVREGSFPIPSLSPGQSCKFTESAGRTVDIKLNNPDPSVDGKYYLNTISGLENDCERTPPELIKFNEPKSYRCEPKGAEIEIKNVLIPPRSAVIQYRLSSNPISVPE